MASNSHRKSGSSGRSTGRKRVVIGATETVRVRYKKDKPEVESERRRTGPKSDRTPKRKAKGPGARLAHAKRDEREIRLRIAARRRWFIGAALVVAAVAILAGLVALWRAPFFSVDSVTVSGVKRLTSAQVLAEAAVPAGATLTRLPRKAIVKRLLADPWIADARVMARFPHALEISITERTPAAIVDAGGTSIWLIDGSGVWLGKSSGEASGTLPVVRDIEALKPTPGTTTDSPELANALAVIGGLGADLRAKVRTVSAPTVDKTALILPRGVQVFVGSAEDIAKKSTVAQAILNQNKNVVYVNVRVVNRPTWRGLDSGN
ncbi:MAG: FtsQ-type POTRA domain-containing protein [Coriobacteriia bacterium]|nr:FtsQ-type POTRA domain-containing protein [Coriobacteriia bacterium]